MLSAIGDWLFPAQNPINPQPTINSQPSTTSRLTPYPLELDHWFAAETSLLQHVRARFCPQATEVPATTTAQSRQPATVLHSSYSSHSSHSSQPSAPAAPGPQPSSPGHPEAAGTAAAPPPVPPHPAGEGRGEGLQHGRSSPRLQKQICAPGSKLDTIADLLHTFTLNLLSALHPDPETLRLLDRLLKRSLDFEKLRLHRDQRRRPPRPRSTIFGDPAQDDEDNELAPGELSNSEKLALMRKLYFADVDELERSGRIKIPPPPDPWEIRSAKDPMDSFAYEI